MSTAVQRLGGFAARLDGADVPEPVLDAAALHALDALGCGLAADALGEVPWAKRALDDDATGPATAIGLGHGVAAADAALVNGTLCHALDYDDTHPAAIVHVSAVVVPAALAVGEARGASGAELLTAMVVGNEVAIRLGMAAGRAFHARGLHSTGVCGVFGATAAAARLIGLDAVRTADALGLAASMASGTLEFLGDGAQTKPMHAGWAAHAGVTAARFAAGGAQGPAAAIEGERGLFATYLHGVACDVAGALDDLGATWQTPNIAFKPHPVCHYIHAPLDTLAQLQRDHRLAATDVASVVVSADDLTIALVLDPIETKRAPRTPYDAKFSLPYCLASQLVRGSVGIEAFTPTAITDRDVRALAALVSYERHDFATPTNEMMGGVRVRCHDGRVLDAPPRKARGAGGPPITERDVRGKFRTNARTALDPDAVVALEAAVTSLRTSPDLAALRVLRGSAAVTYP